MSPIYLYIKTHNITGLKYFGKTIAKDPYAYKGSGTHWVAHIRKHGYDVTTTIYGTYYDKLECQIAAMAFSEENNIVESNEWANLRIENLDGGDTSHTDGYKKSLHKIGEAARKHKWWNDGVTQAFSEMPPSENHVRGRLHFNNSGAKLGGAAQKGKIWVNNSIEECMVYTDAIPNGFTKGRLKSKLKSLTPRHFNKGTKWWNNGEIELMTNSPLESFVPGRLKRIK